jgi:serine/threonine protein kinase
MTGGLTFTLADLDLGDPNIQLPEKIGHSAIHGRLGKGGMGVVLDASTPLGERVALKLIRPAGDIERTNINAQRLVREARILQRLAHPGIVRLLDSGILEEEGLVYLAMEQVIGVTLYDVRRHTSVDANTLGALGVHLSDTLIHMHQAGIVHRDIKPENVIIDRAGRAILADFGIARHEGATGITEAGEIVGSVGYLAPECFQGENPGPLSDQYALGRLLFEMASTRPPKPIESGTPILAMFALKMEMEWDRFPRDPPWPALERIIRRMTAEFPSERFEDARAAKAAFEEFGSLMGVQYVGHDFAPRGAEPEEAVVNPTVFAPSRTLSVFVDRLGLEPHSLWAEDMSERSDFCELITLSRAATSGEEIMLPPPSTPIEPISPPKPRVPPQPALPRRRLMRLGAAGLAAGILAGTLLSWMVAPELEPRFHYRGPPADNDLARELLLEAQRKLEEKDLDSAERSLGECIEIADLPQCHRVLGVMLSITGDPAAAAHLSR